MEIDRIQTWSFGVLVAAAMAMVPLAVVPIDFLAFMMAVIAFVVTLGIGHAKIQVGRKGCVTILGGRLENATLVEGDHWIPQPLISFEEVDVRVREVALAKQKVNTRDGVLTTIDVFAEVQASNLYVVLGNENVLGSKPDGQITDGLVFNRLQTALRETTQEIRLLDIEELEDGKKRGQIEHDSILEFAGKLRDALNRSGEGALAGTGVTLNKLRIENIDPPDSIKKELERLLNESLQAKSEKKEGTTLEALALGYFKQAKDNGSPISMSRAYDLAAAQQGHTTRVVVEGSGGDFTKSKVVENAMSKRDQREPRKG